MPRRFLVTAAAWFGLASAVISQQPAASSPASAEVALALRDYRDALAALKTLERTLEEGTRRRLEALLAPRPQVPATFSLAPAAAPSAAAVPFSLPPNPLSAVALAGLLGSRTAGVSQSAGAADALKRIDQRLTDLESRMKLLERNVSRLAEGESKIQQILDSFLKNLESFDRRLRDLTARVPPSDNQGELKKK
jgi:hypothetical protein